MRRRVASGSRRWVVFAVLASICLLGAEALARVGGGESYGGGGSSDGGGGDSDGGLIVWLIYLALRHPVVGLPVLVLVVVGWYLKRRYDTAHALPASAQQRLIQQRSGAGAAERLRVKTQLEALLQDDPNFSEILFLDFAQMIYVRYQEGRGSRGAAGLAGYLSGELLSGLQGMGTRLGGGRFQVESVVVGSIRISNVLALGEQWRIACEVEANFRERTSIEGQAERTEDLFVRSRMHFARRKGVLSKGPDQIRTLGCPSCSSPMKLDESNLCAYCGQPAMPGVFHWELVSQEEGMRMRRLEVPMQLGGQELGTDFPTVFDPDLDAATRSFLARYPTESLKVLEQRATQVFLGLQQAWTSGHWERARAFETDRLFQTHLFWTSRYQERGLRNVLEQVEVQQVELVRLGRDAFFETATLRIRASMIDYTEDGHGNLRAGSKERARVFSEYWTFLRKAGFEPGKQTGTTSCPSCGAPVQVAMNGRCDYCDANLSSGDFDWTLAQIEQDEAYTG